MEKVLGKVQQDFTEEEAECWVVTDGAVALKAFATLWRAHQWRRTTKIYRGSVAPYGAGYYVRENDAWHVRAATAPEWQKVEDAEGVERAVKASEEQYRHRLQLVSVGRGGDDS